MIHTLDPFPPAFPFPSPSNPHKTTIFSLAIFYNAPRYQGYSLHSRCDIQVAILSPCGSDKIHFWLLSAMCLEVFFTPPKALLIDPLFLYTVTKGSDAIERLVDTLMCLWNLVYAIGKSTESHVHTM